MCLKKDIGKLIDDYALEMIKQTKDARELFNRKQKEIKVENMDFEKERQLIKDEFRKLNNSLEQIKQLKSNKNEQIKSVEIKLNNLNKLTNQLKFSSFEVCTNVFSSWLFGKLNLDLNPILISCSRDK